MEELNIKELKENPKTFYLASELEKIIKNIEETKALSETDAEMAEMAKEELTTLENTKTIIGDQIKAILESEKAEEEFPNEILLEVRAGAGGDEASLFAAELAGMYIGYANQMGWGVKRLSESESDVGGYKEAVFEIKGIDV